MRYCWICHEYIPDDQATKDHVIPKHGRTPGFVGPWFWAHKVCNNTRSNISFQSIERIQKYLDQKYSEWGQEEIIYAMKTKLHRKLTPGKLAKAG